MSFDEEALTPPERLTFKRIIVEERGQMKNSQSLHYLRSGISRGLSADYYIEQELPDHIRVLLGRLSLLDNQAGAGASGVERNVDSANPRLTDNKVRRELNRYVDRLRAYLPDWLCRTVKWLREPDRLIARVMVSLVLVVGGLFSFLPVLGLWMLPLGLIIISQDLTFLQRPLLHLFGWTEHQYGNLRGLFKTNGGGGKFTHHGQ
jgi:hypothetical protein